MGDEDILSNESRGVAQILLKVMQPVMERAEVLLRAFPEWEYTCAYTTAERYRHRSLEQFQRAVNENISILRALSDENGRPLLPLWDEVLR